MVFIYSVLFSITQKDLFSILAKAVCVSSKITSKILQSTGLCGHMSINTIVFFLLDKYILYTSLLSKEPPTLHYKLQLASNQALLHL